MKNVTFYSLFNTSKEQIQANYLLFLLFHGSIDPSFFKVKKFKIPNDTVDIRFTVSFQFLLKSSILLLKESN